MNQPSLFDVASIDVFTACPSCGHSWHCANILPGAWWAKGITPENCAGRVYCPSCQQPPPMKVVQP